MVYACLIVPLPHSVSSDAVVSTVVPPNAGTNNDTLTDPDTMPDSRLRLYMPVHPSPSCCDRANGANKFNSEPVAELSHVCLEFLTQLPA